MQYTGRGEDLPIYIANLSRCQYEPWFPSLNFAFFCDLLESMGIFTKKERAKTPAHNQSASSASALPAPDSSRSGLYGLQSHHPQSDHEYTDQDSRLTAFTSSAFGSRSGLTSYSDVSRTESLIIVCTLQAHNPGLQ